MSVLRSAVIALAGFAAMVPLPARAVENSVALDPGKSQVTFILDATAHEVRGVLALRTGGVRFDPATGAASGEVVIELVGATTGNDRRDRKMHEDVLETAKFPVATFRIRRVIGTFVENGVSELGLEGTLGIHGADRPLTVQAKVSSRGDSVSAELEVAIPFVAWGLKDPSILFLRVAKVVAVHVAAEGRLRRNVPAAAAH